MAEEEEIDEWEILENPCPLPKISPKDLIQAANSKVSLAQILSQTNIQFEQAFNSSGWTHKCLCPFPDHPERTASFAYNPSKGIFKCFGCHRGGKSVAFYSALHSLSSTSAAEEILAVNFQDKNIEILVKEDQEEEIQGLLFRYSKYHRDFLKRYKSPEALTYAENVSWSLDVYLAKNFDKLSPKELAKRIEKMKEYLDAFG